MKNKRIARNLVAISLMSLYFSCGRHDILDDRTERSALKPVNITLVSAPGRQGKEPCPLEKQAALGENPQPVPEMVLSRGEKNAELFRGFPPPD